MKACAIIAGSFLIAFSSLCATNSLENFSPHLPVGTPILWTATMTNLPGTFWVYKKILPRVFPASVISNAVVLAGCQSRGFPPPSTNDTWIFDDPDCNCECLRICNFSIQPGSAQIDFFSPDQNKFTGQIPGDQAIEKWAREDAAKLGIDLRDIVKRNMTSHFNTDTNDNPLTNQQCGRGINLSRQLDGFCYWGTGDNGPNEGLWMEFDCQGKIRTFSLIWPEVVRDHREKAASQRQLTACIRAHRVIVVPGAEEEKYFQRLNSLTNTTTFTITRITPCYSDGRLGETPADDGISPFAIPFAELEAVAELGNATVPVTLVAPILSADVNRLLGTKND